jgi:putative tricarboxylic transport membrane protein
MSGPWAQAFALVFDPYNIVVMLAASAFGLFVCAVPGLTATKAEA